MKQDYRSKAKANKTSLVNITSSSSAKDLSMDDISL
jgi:hypothetical protein